MNGDPDHEFDGIFLAQSHKPFTRPPKVIASKRFVDEVRAALDLGPEDGARAADWIADKMDRFAAAHSVMHFAEDGSGPWCSYCGAIFGLCGHNIIAAQFEDDQTEEE